MIEIEDNEEDDGNNNKAEDGKTDGKNDKAEDVDSQLHPNSSDSEGEEGIGFTNGLAMLPPSSSSKNAAKIQAVYLTADTTVAIRITVTMIMDCQIDPQQLLVHMD